MTPEQRGEIFAHWEEQLRTMPSCCGLDGRVEINGTCWPRHDFGRRVVDVMYLCDAVEAEGGDSISIAWLRAVMCDLTNQDHSWTLDAWPTRSSRYRR